MLLKSCGCRKGNSTISLICASCLRQPPMSSYPISLSLFSSYSSLAIRVSSVRIASTETYHRMHTNRYVRFSVFFSGWLHQKKGRRMYHAKLFRLHLSTLELDRAHRRSADEGIAHLQRAGAISEVRGQKGFFQITG